MDINTPEQRVRTLVDVACADRNRMFDLPPMIHGLPHAGPATAVWLNAFGESVTGVHGAPWPNCTFRENVLYVHQGTEVPDLPAKVITSQRLSDSIRKVVYDRPLEPLARAAASAGSVTAGTTGIDVDLGKSISFNRLEFTIDNPAYQRGQGKHFELQTRQPDGTWRTVHDGAMYGTIYSNRLARVKAQYLRLKVDAPLRQFGLLRGQQ